MSTGLRRLLVGLVAGTLLMTGAASAADAHHPSKLDRLRFATAPYFDIDEAVEDGYGELKDAEGIACIDSGDPHEGAMGIHYVNGTLVGDSQVRLLKPEALIYEPQEDGDMELVAVEYVVFRKAWREAHPTGRPHLMGQEFSLVKAGNRYGLPAFFELHVWAWRHNPHGMFEDYNPRVSCEFAPAA
ncbi:hypothetical protein ACT8ZV_09655 [Nocardioides sp. MAHUQ-72]|uniref:hypothetical protein n=1 Tax=unclassified Nocardioides TaxID=2615069 RepID=UPI0036180C3A